MANEKLRAALQHAGLTPDDLAQIVQVDIRTIRRWLSGRTPYPRQRTKVAHALDTTQRHLWPHIATPPPPTTAQPTDLLAAYPTASDLAAPDWKTLMRDSTHRIELLDDTLTSILDTPGATELLATKATHQCNIRILVANPGPGLAPIANQPGIEIRVLQARPHQTIYRFDEQLLLTLNLLGQDADQAPLLHLRRAAPGGLFDRFAEHYNQIWEQHSQPIKPAVGLESDEYEAETTEADPRAPVAEQPSTSRSEPPVQPPRHWPRRPT